MNAPNRARVEPAESKSRSVFSVSNAGVPQALVCDRVVLRRPFRGHVAVRSRTDKEAVQTVWSCADAFIAFKGDNFDSAPKLVGYHMRPEARARGREVSSRRHITKSGFAICAYRDRASVLPEPASATMMLNAALPSAKAKFDGQATKRWRRRPGRAQPGFSPNYISAKRYECRWRPALSIFTHFSGDIDVFD